jgi:hypothetical protein
MHQRDAAIKAWEDSGLFRTGDRRLTELLERVRHSGFDCWPELAALVRSEYASYKERLARPLWDSGDTLLRVNLIRAAEPATHKDEERILTRFARELDPEAHPHEVLALALVAGPKLREQLAKRKDMPPRLAAVLARPGTSPGLRDIKRGN